MSRRPLVQMKMRTLGEDATRPLKAHVLASWRRGGANAAGEATAALSSEREKCIKARPFSAETRKTRKFDSVFVKCAENEARRKTSVKTKGLLAGRGAGCGIAKLNEQTCHVFTSFAHVTKQASPAIGPR